jgi:hypothetical protein
MVCSSKMPLRLVTTNLFPLRKTKIKGNAFYGLYQQKSSDDVIITASGSVETTQGNAPR